VGGPAFDWDAPFGDRLWVAQLRLSNVPTHSAYDPHFRLEVQGKFTPEHHFGIEIWDQHPIFPTLKPIDVFLTMQSVSSLMSAHITTREVRYRR